MTHRPIKKVQRTSVIFTVAVLLNLAVCIIFYHKIAEKPTFLPNLHFGLIWSSLMCFVIALPTFMLAALLDPGYIKSKYNFIELVDKLLDEGLHLDNLCVYDEIIRSETSFHCTICNKCVEKFDHHCPFINNCLGARNHNLFLVFIFTYTSFVILVFVETIRHLIELGKLGKDETGIYSFTSTSIVLFVIVLLIPVVFY